MSQEALWIRVSVAAQVLELLEGEEVLSTYQVSTAANGCGEPMGEPRSHGCVRMRNADVIDLFDKIAVGTPVRIDG